MKLNATLLLLLASGSAALAQPTLTTSTSSPTAGLSMQIFGNSTYNPGSGGASQTWDFSTQSFTAAGPTTYETCSAANGCNAFPNTNLVGNGGGGTYAYYAVGGTALAWTGIAAGGVNIVYTNQEDMLRFPMTYNSSFVDSWAGSFTSGGVAFIRKGTDSVLADGWGTLKTPAGTFSNTLRIKRIQTYSDSANLGGMPYLIKYKATVYAWYDVAHKDFLYGASTVTTTPATGGATTNGYSRYTTNQALGINPHSTLALDYAVSPNPVINQLHISMELPVAAPVAANLINITGQEVRSLKTATLPAGKNILTMTTEGLAAGVYILRITAGDAAATQRVVVAQ